jgi:hypothetical protein
VIGNTTAAGTGVTITNGSKIMVWSDATNFYELQAANLTGTLAVANGGTGLTAFTANGVVYASGTTTLASGSALTFNGTDLGIASVKSTTALNLYAASAYDVNLYTGSTNTARLSSNVNGVFTVGPQGSVAGVGTDYGTLGAWGSAGGGLRIYRGTGAGTSSAVFYADGTGVFISGNENVPMVFSTNSTERGRITGAGAWSFGATGTNYGTSGQLLSSQGSSTNPTWVDQSTIAAGTATLATLATTATLATLATLATQARSALIRSQTEQASTSGTSIDFTGIPSNAKRITIMFAGVSTNGSSIMQVQVGAGSIATSGYNSVCSYAYAGQVTGFVTTSTSAFVVSGSGIGAAAALSGSIVLTNLSSLVWVAQGVMVALPSADPSVHAAGGTVTLSGALDRVRITTVNGTDTFDAGSINILYE